VAEWPGHNESEGRRSTGNNGCTIGWPRQFPLNLQPGVDVGVDYNHAFYFTTPCFMVATIDESWALIFADSKESSRVEVQSFRIHFN